MGDVHRRIEADDARRAFERVGSPHEFFEPGGVGRIAFQRQQAFREDGRLVLGFKPEQLVHGEIA